ncbi:glycosyltransferase family 4 protein [Cryomorphaceae bacterium]|nr:glycosyltransferase family 4 protein [Cryomorphaceae bacterium]
MKIGFDGKRAEHNTSGLGNYSRDVIRGLCMNAPEHEYVLYSPKKGTEFDFGDERLVRRYPTRWKDRLTPALWRRKGIVDDLKNEGIDLYHGLSNELPSGIEAIRARSIVTVHDLIFERFPDYYKGIDRMIYRSKTKEACSSADHIIAISEQTKQDLIEFYSVSPDKISVVYQTCHPGFQKEVKDETVEQVRTGYQLPQSYVLQVGTLEPRKNVLRSLEAVSQINDLHIAFVGRQTDHQKLIERRVESLGIGSRVHFLQDVPVAFLPALFKGAAASLYPSLFEGFGLPIIESLFQGTPVVTNEKGCFKEAGGSFGYYANVEDPTSIAHALKRVLTDGLSTEGLEGHLGQFTLKETTRRLLDVYQQVVKNS